MNLMTLSSEGKIAYLIKPILKVLQEAGGQNDTMSLPCPSRKSISS